MSAATISIVGPAVICPPATPSTCEPACATQTIPVTQAPRRDVFEKAYTTLYTAGSAVPVIGAAVNGVQTLRSWGESIGKDSPSTAQYGFPAFLAACLNAGGALALGLFDPTIHSAIPAAVCLSTAAILGGVSAHNSLKANQTLIDAGKNAPPSRGAFTPIYTTAMAALSAVPGMGAALNLVQIFRNDTDAKIGIPAFAALATNALSIASYCTQSGPLLTGALVATSGLMGGIAAFNASRQHAALVGS